MKRPHSVCCSLPVTPVGFHRGSKALAKNQILPGFLSLTQQIRSSDSSSFQGNSVREGGGTGDFFFFKEVSYVLGMQTLNT